MSEGLSPISTTINTQPIIESIAGKIEARPSHIGTVLQLLKEGGTVPFIARYRKEQTGSMTENDIRTIQTEFETAYKLEERRITVLQSIFSQQKLTPELQKKVMGAKTLTEVEDLYLPYKPKRKTLATKALEKGLGPLAAIIREERIDGNRDEILKQFYGEPKVDKKKEDKLGEEKKEKKETEEKKEKKEGEEAVERCKTAKEALDGAMDIIAEDIGNTADFRKYVREICFEKSVMLSKVNKQYEHLKKTDEQRQKEAEEKAKQQEAAVVESPKQAAKEDAIKKEEELARRLKIIEDDSKLTDAQKRIAIMKEKIKIGQEEEKRKADERKKQQEAQLLKKQKKELAGTEGGEGGGLNAEGLGAKVVDPLVYEMYFEFEQEAKGMPHHRVLAINRGEKEGVLDVSFKHPEDDLLNWMKSQVIKRPESLFLQEYAKSVEYAYRRYIIKAIEREIRSDITDKAEEHAIGVFAKNLKALLMQPPLKERKIIAIDPGYAHGCKIALIDKQGNYVDTSDLIPDNIIYATPGPKSNPPLAKRQLLSVMEKYQAFTLSIGNGTASREAEAFAASLVKENRKIEYVIVNEAGASVYSASDMANEEFPTLSVEARGAISIARRLQDPLSELIKIDAKSIGVGLYQHDVNQVALRKAVDAVVEDCVNSVGVFVNSASYKLLEHISGLSKTLARAVYDHVRNKGPLTCREDLKKVAGIGAKTFEQCAGFLRILNGTNPIDSTPIHPESYWIAEGIFNHLKVNPTVLQDPTLRKDLEPKIKEMKPKELIDFLGKDVGLPTLKDIVMALLRPGRDPRDDLPPVILKKDVLKIEDIRPGMVLRGTVRNVVDFGAFFDIGVHEDGLIHISEMVRRDGGGYIEDPTEVLSVGEILDVRVVSVDFKRHRVQLSMKLEPDKPGAQGMPGMPGERTGGSGPRPYTPREPRPYTPRDGSAPPRNMPRRDAEQSGGGMGAGISMRSGAAQKLQKSDFKEENVLKCVEAFNKGIEGIKYRVENQARVLNKYIPIRKDALGGLIILSTKQYLKKANKTIPDLVKMNDAAEAEAYDAIYQILMAGVKLTLNTSSKLMLVEQAFNEAKSEFFETL